MLHVLSKGAETAMFAACTFGDISRTDEHIEQFAKLGLRTLVLGHKVISQVC